jgi:DNA-directed RNA polymerase sigma subunit (sigma70/sigma32)
MTTDTLDNPSINAFPPFVTIPISLLQSLQEGLESLKDEVQALRATITARDEKIATMEARISLQEDNGLIQLRLIHDLREEKLSTAEKLPTQKTQDHITEIAHILANKEKRLIEGHAGNAYVVKLRREGMTFSQLARVMGLTVDRIRQLSRVAATDQRFNITWHPRKKNTKIFKLRRWDAQ